VLALVSFEAHPLHPDLHDGRLGADEFEGSECGEGIDVWKLVRSVFASNNGYLIGPLDHGFIHIDLE
jgi:hypothetical protein